MADFTTTECFGCSAPVAPEPGNFYCDACVAVQEIEHEAEFEAFCAYHRWADSHRAREG